MAIAKLTEQYSLEDMKSWWNDLDYQGPRRWKEEHPGKGVIGTFPVWVPNEIICAAGALPVGLLGAGSLLDLEYADARMQSFICSISRSTLELGLRGHLDFLDGMVFPSICDVARNLSGVWARNFKDKYVCFLHLPENIASPHAVQYMKDELDRLKLGLETRLNCKITDDAIRSAIQDYNENRKLLRALYQLRQDTPHIISSQELFSLMRAGFVMPVQEHNDLLGQAFRTVRERKTKPKDRIRILIEGSFCEQPPMELIWAIEEAGCYVLDDDFVMGNRYLTSDVKVAGDPLENLAVTYLQSARPSAIRYDGPKIRNEEFMNRVRKHHVDGVIFSYAKFCDPAQFDYVLLKDQLEKANIPHLTLEFEEKMTIFESVQNQVETFVESILFYE